MFYLKKKKKKKYNKKLAKHNSQIAKIMYIFYI